MAEHRVLGRIVPTSRPTEEENRFVRLYDDTGRKLRFDSKDDVFAMVEDSEYCAMFKAFDEDEATRVQFPAVIELEVPWSVGLPPGNDQLPPSFQHALVIQLCPHLTRCCELPGPNEMHLCQFSNLCRLNVNDGGLRRHRTSEGIECVIPIFREPRVKAILEKRSVDIIEGGKRERQHWRYFQFCANCRAARAVGRCSHWFHAVARHPEEVREVEKGELSDLDRQWGVPSGKAGNVYSDMILSEDVIILGEDVH